MSKKPTYEELEQKVRELENSIDGFKQIELALRKSESMFRAIFNQSFQFAIILDINGNAIEVNDLCYEICGQFAEGVIGNPFWDAGWWKQFPEIRKSTQLAIQKTLQDNIITDEAIFIDKDRQVRHGIRIFSPIKDETDKIQMISVVGLDVSEVKQAEEALQESEKRFSALIHRIQAAVVVHRADTSIAMSNRSAQVLLGLTEDQMLGKTTIDPAWRFFREDNTAMSHEEYPVNRVISTQEPLRNFTAGIYRPSTKDTVWVLVNADPVFDYKGNIQQVIVTFMDITERQQAERAVKAEKEFAASLIDNAPTSFVAIDPQGETKMMNQYMLKVLGYKADEVVGKDYLSNFVPERERDTLASVFKRLTAEHKPTLHENHILSKDGKEFLVEWHGMPVFDINRKFQYFYGIGIDITERKKMEEALRESEEKYRSLLDDVVDSSEVGLFILDPDFKVVWVNQALERYFGMRREEVVGKDKRQLILKQIKHNFEDPEGFAERVLATYDNNTYIENFECHMLSSDKREGRWLEHWSRPIRSGIYSGGRVELYYNITDRVRTEELLRESEERYREIVEETDDLITRVDSEGQFIYVNHVAEKIFGINTDQCFGMSAFDFVHPDDRERTKAEFTGWIRNRLRSVTIQNRQVNKITGEVYYMFWTSNLHYDEKGSLTGINGIARDLTKYKKLEEELLKAKKIESVGILAGGIAHDFNNLLSVIMGNIELAKDDIKLEAEALDFLKEAVNASLQAQELTKQLITFSKGGAPIKRIGSIEDLVKETTNFALSGSKVKASFFLPHDLWFVEFDEGQMKHAVKNVIDNAVEAMHDGGFIDIRAENFKISLETIEQGLKLHQGKYVKISIRDYGAGIPEEHLPMVFDPYFSTKEMGVQKGMGMGLATTYSIIDQHNGYIAVESEIEIGTTFTLYLPAHEKDIKELEPIPTPKPAKPAIRTGRILLMDDEEMIRNLGRQMLIRVGYDVELAKDGVEAIELYQKAMDSGKPFDVVILDLTVKGGIGGRDAVKKILEINPQAKAIVSSGYSNDPVITHFREYGFIEALPKPYTVKDLSDALNKVTKE